MAKRIIKKYCIKGFRKLRHRRGYGVHSPFAFDFITSVIEEKYPYYCYNEIETIREKKLRPLLNRCILNSREELSFKKTALIFRIVNRFKPENILEVGTSWGISTLYMRAARSQTGIVVVEPDNNVLAVAKNLFSGVDAKISWLQGRLSEINLCDRKDRFDFVFMHKSKSAEDYEAVFEYAVNCAGSDTIMAFDGIHSCGSIHRQWKKMIAHEQIRVSMDLYDIGILFFNRKLNKQHYVVAF